MRKFLVLPVLWLALLLSAPVHGQISTFPPAGKSLGSATAPESGKWIVFATGFNPVQPTLLDGGKAIWWVGDAGEYAVIFFPPGDGQPVVSKVTLGGVAPKPPDPIDPPTPGGPYQIVLLYDPDQLDNLTADQRAILNSQAFRQQLKQDGHLLLGVLPSNAKPAEGSKFRAFYNVAGRDPMPRLAVASKTEGGPIKSLPLPATVEELTALLKTEVLQ